MGGMPFHLEKGCMGLRFDYLCRSQLVRQFLLAKLQAGGDPFVVAAHITVAGITIDALNESKGSFKTKLDQLETADPGRFDAEERRSGLEYDNDQTHLLPLNQDTAGNRYAFVTYWTNAKSNCSNVEGDARAAMVKALQAVGPGAPALPKPRMDFWWDCTLDNGECPTVQCSLDSPRVARVLFITDHPSAVAEPSRWKRARARRPRASGSVTVRTQ